MFFITYMSFIQNPGGVYLYRFSQKKVFFFAATGMHQIIDNVQQNISLISRPLSQTFIESAQFRMSKVAQYFLLRHLLSFK
jgi:hypothetical protein